MLTILGRVTSINVRKVLWAADTLALPYRREDWGLPLRDPKVPEFLALNPNGQVPVLVDGDFVLWESNAILIYLSERAGQLMPEQIEQRALVLQWLAWQASELNPAWSYAVNALIRRTPGFDDAGKIAQSMTRWTSKMAILEDELSRSDTMLGQSVLHVADIALGLSIHRWMSIPLDKQAFPAVQGYYDRLKTQEAGARWMGAQTP